MKDREFYKSFFRLYVVLVLQNIVTLSVNLADNIMLGSYGEISLSGVTSVNQIQFLYQQLLIAFGDGMVIFCSQYWGKKQFAPMKKIIALAMHFGIAVAVILFAVISVFPEQAMLCFTSDRQIIEEGVRYLHTIRFTYLFFCSNTDAFGGASQYGSCRDCFTLVCDGAGCELWNQLCTDFRKILRTRTWSDRSGHRYLNGQNSGMWNFDLLCGT